MNIGAGQAEFDLMRERMHSARSLMQDGQCGPWKELFSQGADVTLLGAYGGYSQGWPEVSARLQGTAAEYAPGAGKTTYVNVASWVMRDLACIVELERRRTTVDGSDDELEYGYRVTHLLRRENGAWKIVLRHADLLPDYSRP